MCFEMLKYGRSRGIVGFHILRPDWNHFPVQSRIIFKLLTIAHQSVSSGEPSHMLSMPFLPPKSKEIHSSGFHLLSLSRVKTQVRTHPYSVAIPTLWKWDYWFPSPLKIHLFMFACHSKVFAASVYFRRIMHCTLIIRLPNPVLGAVLSWNISEYIGTINVR